jgi:hypothetical protein
VSERKIWQHGAGWRCIETGCGTAPRCAHEPYIRVQFKGDRKSGYGPVSKFHFLLEPHEQLPSTRRGVENLAARVLTWLQRGKPMPHPVALVVAMTVNDLLDRYYATHPRTFRKDGTRIAFESKVNTVRRVFGALTLADFETGAALAQYVEDSLKAGHKIATPNSVIATVLRPATRWGAAQKVPLVANNPFGLHRFTLNRDAEEKRTQRCAPETEARLLDASAVLNRPGVQPLRADGRGFYCARH